MSADNKLKELILSRALKVAEEPIFRLSSGKLSRYYIDLKQVTLDPEGAYLVGKLMYELVRQFGVQGVGGLTLGADPIAYAVAFVSYLDGKSYKALCGQKGAKGTRHGKAVGGTPEGRGKGGGGGGCDHYR
jgi:orotate phosphoribosyltransferase